MPRKGRPPKLTPERVNVVVRAIRDGNTRACAAAIAGLSLDTLQTWLKKGREGDPVYADFADRVRKADGRIEARMVRTMVSSGQLDWRAASAWLGARRQKTWGERSQADVHVHRDTLDWSNLSDDELDTTLALLAKTRKDPTP